METIINIFNNREKALFIWILIALVCILVTKNFRIPFLSLLKALFASKIAIGLLIMLAYISLVVFATYKAHFWDISLLKDTIMWVVGTACIIFINSNKASEDSKYFKKVLLDNVKLVVVLEFIINLYVFNFVVELLLFPLLIFIAALLAYSSTKKEYTPVKNILQFLLTIYGMFLIIFTIVQVVSDFKDFATLYNLKDFLLTPLLTISFLPFIYLLALYATYSTLFVQVNIFLRDQSKELRRLTKRQILRTCLLNLKKLKRFSANYTTKLMAVENKADVLNLTRQFRSSSRL